MGIFKRPPRPANSCIECRNSCLTLGQGRDNSVELSLRANWLFATFFTVGLQRGKASAVFVLNER